MATFIRPFYQNLDKKLPIISFTACIITMAIGMIALTGWLTHNDQLRSIIPGIANMKFNTALCFVLSSIVVLGSYIPAKHKILHLFFIGLAVFVSLVGLLTLVEYISGINIGIDELFIRDEIRTTAFYYAGRLSPLSAISFLLIGIGLLLLNKQSAAAYHFFYLIGISFISLFMLMGLNFVTDIPAFIRVEIHVTAGFIMLSIAIWFAQPMLHKKISFERKLFTCFSVIIFLIVIISTFSFYYTNKLTDTAKRVNHTNSVLSEVEETLSLVNDIESGGRSYIITGDSNYLEYYTLSKKNVFIHTNNLQDLTSDNPEQQVRIDSLTALIKKQIAFTQQRIQGRGKKGFSRTEELIATRLGKSYANEIRHAASAIKRVENSLFARRQEASANSIASFTVVFHIFLASVFTLLVIILFSIRNNIAIRKEVSEKLKSANKELAFQNNEKEKRAVELITANKELAFQNEEKENRAAELIIANKELAFQNDEKENRAAELIIANKELAFQNDEKENRAAELIIANKELAFQNNEKENRAAELIIANKELAFQNDEKENRAAELIIANKELAFQNDEKENRAAELIIANKELAFQNKEKENRAAELIIANKELAFQNKEKENRAAELEESNNRYNYVTKATFDAIWDWNLVTETIYWGEGFETIFGYSPGKVNSDISSWTDHIHREDIDRVLKGIYEVINGTQNNWVDEYRYHKADQTYAYVIDKGIIIRDAQGKGIRMVGSMHDVTDKKALEDLLDKATRLAGIGSWEVDLLKNTLYWSDITKEIHETAPDYIPDFDHAINFYVEGKDREIITKKVKEGIRNGTSWDVELQIITAKGNKKWIRTIGQAEFENGKQTMIYGSFQDIDARKKNEIAVTQAFEEKNTILESIGDAFFAVDKNWIVTYWNNQSEKLLLKQKDEIIGLSLWDVFSDSIDSASYKKYHRARESNEVVHFEDYYPALNKWYEISAYPSDNGLSVYFKDITDRKLAEISMNQLNENIQKHAKELATSNEALEQFAYVASHDLQEPLRMVTSFMTQLDKKYSDIIDQKGRTYIAFAVDGAKRMRQIILDLLDFSRIGKIEDKQEKVDLNEMLAEIQILLSKKIEEKSATIHLIRLPVIHAYKAPLRQVFQNLIGNALKYAKEDVPSRIQIAARELKTHWQFSVTDNSIGISEEYFEKIFVIFQRLHTKEQFSGTGMGLAVAKKIVENLGGKIWVESEEGTGSTFYFTLLKQPKPGILE